MGGHTDIVRLLYEYAHSLGLRLDDTENGDGKTPKDIALRKGLTDIVHTSQSSQDILNTHFNICTKQLLQ